MILAATSTLLSSSAEVQQSSSVSMDGLTGSLENGDASQLSTRQENNVPDRNLSQCMSEESNRESIATNDDVTEEELKITLLSSVEDRLKFKLEEEVSKTQAELQSLHHTNIELLDRQEDICKIDRELDEKLQDISHYNKELLSCERELQQYMKNLKQNVKVIIRVRGGYLYSPFTPPIKNQS